MRFDDFNENSDNYKSLISSIENKELISKQIIENLSQEFFSSNGKKQMVYALENRIDILYKVIRNYLKNSKELPSSSLFKLYLEKTNDFELLIELMIDRTNLIAWDAMSVLIQHSSEYHSICIDYSIKYLDSGFSEFNINALKILFKLNNAEALKYFSSQMRIIELSSIQQNIYLGYTVTLEVIESEIEKLFNDIYKLPLDKNDDDWEFAYNNSFFCASIN